MISHFPEIIQMLLATKQRSTSDKDKVLNRSSAKVHQGCLVIWHTPMQTLVGLFSAVIIETIIYFKVTGIYFILKFPSMVYLTNKPMSWLWYEGIYLFCHTLVNSASTFFNKEGSMIEKNSVGMCEKTSQALSSVLTLSRLIRRENFVVLTTLRQDKLYLLTSTFHDVARVLDKTENTEILLIRVYGCL